MNELLKVKRERKKVKPKFARTDSNKYKFRGWKKPRGIHNKQRRGVKGHVKSPKLGYASPLEVKFLNKHGLKPILVKNIDELKKLDKKAASIIMGRIGLKKKLELIKKCMDLGFKIDNVKDANKFLEETNKFLEEKKTLKKEKEKKKEKTKQELEKKAKEKEEKPKETTEEEKKKSVEEKIKEDMKKRSPGDRK